MVKVLFVCLGNICRSPLAEAVFKNLLVQQGLQEKITCDSCGTSDWHIGEQPDYRTINTAMNHGINIHHAGRQFTTQDLQEFDYILAMDRDNFDHIQSLIEEPDQAKKIILMRDFDPESEDKQVPDPYFGGKDGFEEVYNILNKSNRELLKHIVRQHNL